MSLSAEKTLYALPLQNENRKTPVLEHRGFLLNRLMIRAYFLYFASIFRYAIIIPMSKIITANITRTKKGEFCSKNKTGIPMISNTAAAVSHNTDTALL